MLFRSPPVGATGAGHYEAQCWGATSASCTWTWVQDASSGACTSNDCLSYQYGWTETVTSTGTRTFVPIAPPVLSLKAVPQLVRKGEPTTLTWSATNATSCTVSSPTGFSSDGMSGSQVIGNIEEQTVFTLSCDSAAGKAMTTVTVSLVPEWREF